MKKIVYLLTLITAYLVLCNAIQAQQPQTWKVAVVFVRSGDTLTYKGTVNNPVLPGVLSQAQTATPAASDKKHNVDAEIWLAKDGGMAGVWFSSREHTFGYITSSGLSDGYRDDVSISRLVAQAHQAQSVVRPRPGRIAIPTWVQPEPSSLSQLVTASPIIAVGKVVGVLRTAHTPINARYDMQHTVYLFAVEDYLKKSDAMGTKPVLKIWQEGGDLAWDSVTGGAGGRGWEVMEDPTLNIGDRYCLFLKQQPAPSGIAASLGYIQAMNNGVVGRSAELDELIAVSHSVGKLLLRDNKVLPASTADPLPNQQAGSTDLPSFYGLPEQELIASIRKLTAGSGTIPSQGQAVTHQ